MEPINRRFFEWNIYTIIVNKVENLRLEDKPRMTINYSRVYKDLPGTYLKLSSKVYNYFSNPNYSCLFIADLKHAYLTIPLYLDN